MPILNISGIIAILILIIRPFYEFCIFKIKLLNELNRIKEELKNIPYMISASTAYLTRMKNDIEKGVKQSKLNEKILSQAILKELRALDIPATRACDYLNELTYFRVQSVRKSLERMEVDMIKFLNPKEVREAQYIMMFLDHAIKYHEDALKLAHNSKERNECLVGFNFMLRSASDNKRYSQALLRLKRWDLLPHLNIGTEFPIFNDDSEIEQLDKLIQD